MKCLSHDEPGDGTAAPQSLPGTSAPTPGSPSDSAAVIPNSVWFRDVYRRVIQHNARVSCMTVHQLNNLLEQLLHYPVLSAWLTQHCSAV